MSTEQPRSTLGPVRTRELLEILLYEARSAEVDGQPMDTPAVLRRMDELALASFQWHVDLRRALGSDQYYLLIIDAAGDVNDISEVRASDVFLRGRLRSEWYGVVDGGVVPLNWAAIDPGAPPWTEMRWECIARHALPHMQEERG